MPIRTLIVDDEPLAREAIRGYLASDPEIEVVGEAQDGAEASEMILQKRPDLVFLDVQMPEQDGFSAIEEVQENGSPLPVIVFVTAYDQYALKAFETHALDYLLKPFDEPRFRKALSAAKTRIETDRKVQAGARLIALLAERRAAGGEPRIAIKSKGRIIFLKMAEIDWVEAQDNYVRLHIGQESHLIRETMNAFERRLDSNQFLRIHRSAIVNIDRIREVQPWFTGEYIVRMQNGKELTLTRSYRDNLKRLLDTHCEQGFGA